VITPCQPDELMTIAAARRLRDGATCFVGIGLPGAAANLARRVHAPDLTLVYESGTIGSKPDFLPLSIGDGELAETADTVVPLPEVFAYWLGGGRIDVGLLGAAQIDRFGSLNSTVIGEYEAPRVRLPGAGGAPDIAAMAGEVLVMARHDRRTFVDTLDFITTRARPPRSMLRASTADWGRGVMCVVTDMGVLQRGSSGELVLTAVHPGIQIERVRRATGWPLALGETVDETEPPTVHELKALRELRQRTERAHARHPLRSRPGP
jgi:glutaconate CoA-transferase subunit B